MYPQFVEWEFKSLYRMLLLFHDISYHVTSGFLLSGFLYMTNIHILMAPVYKNSSVSDLSCSFCSVPIRNRVVNVTLTATEIPEAIEAWHLEGRKFDYLGSGKIKACYKLPQPQQNQSGTIYIVLFQKIFHMSGRQHSKKIAFMLALS